MLLVKRLLDAGYISRHANTSTGVYINGMKTDPDLLVITPEGRAFVESLGLHDL